MKYKNLDNILHHSSDLNLDILVEVLDTLGPKCKEMLDSSRMNNDSNNNVEVYNHLENKLKNINVDNIKDYIDGIMNAVKVAHSVDELFVLGEGLTESIEAEELEITDEEPLLGSEDVLIIEDDVIDNVEDILILDSETNAEEEDIFLLDDKLDIDIEDTYKEMFEGVLDYTKESFTLEDILLSFDLGNILNEITHTIEEEYIEEEVEPIIVQSESGDIELESITPFIIDEQGEELALGNIQGEEFLVYKNDNELFLSLDELDEEVIQLFENNK